MPSPTFVLDGQTLRIEDVVRVAREPRTRVTLKPEARRSLLQSRRVVERAIESGQTIYGINTGFGKLANVRIPPDQLDRLQTNLIRSHASGVGSPLPPSVVRAVMLLRANVLLRATSGVRPELVDALIAMLNAGIVPVVPEQGSVGASGDLAPLSHIGLALMGEGQVLSGDARLGSARTALAEAGLAAYRFAPKEGLAFINGTQAQTAMLALMVHDAQLLWRTAIAAAAMSLEALRGTPAPLDARIHSVRPHAGQIRAAKLMRALLEDSAIRESHRENDPRVQDAYSLRCAPQVLGAVADAIEFARQTVAVELNASTDNPLVFENGDVISGGNFHGQPVAQALDVLALTLTTLQAIAERRIERLVNPDLSQGLPAFLTKEPGLCSGLMMVQIAAASLVAESRALAMPASIGSIPTDANQEDFVPMGMAAAFKAGRILTNAQRVVAAELLCAAQGLEFLKPLTPGRGVGELYQRIRSLDPPIRPLSDDRPPAPDLERLAVAVAGGEFDPGPQDR
ncbi:MAG TPA: histidine ammonia-lyase [Gemmatimonadales bacterium]|nr:histidine ammonia-lyase [Gemmatimonadales bacterium]